MAQKTSRDEVWDRALTEALNGGAIRPENLSLRTGVSERTAGDVLRTMADLDWLNKRGGNGPVHVEFVAGERLPKNLTSYSTEEE